MGNTINCTAITTQCAAFIASAPRWIEENGYELTNRIALFIFTPLGGGVFAVGYVTFRPTYTVLGGSILVLAVTVFFLADKNKALGKTLVTAAKDHKVENDRQKAENDRQKAEVDRLQGYVDSVEDLSTLVRTQRRREEELNPIVEQIAEGSTPKERKKHLDTYLRTAAGGFSTPKREARRGSGLTPSTCSAHVDSPLKQGTGQIEGTR